MAGAGMDRRRVYDFLDEETAKKCAAEATVVTGGLVVELDDAFEKQKASRADIQTKPLTAEEKARNLQAAVIETRNALSATGNGNQAEVDTAEDAKKAKSRISRVVKTAVTVRPLWDEESAIAGTADDRGRPQFECVTLLQKETDEGHVSLHSEGRNVVTSRQPRSEASETRKDPAGAVQLKTESAPADKVFGPGYHDGLVDYATNMAISTETCAIVLHGQTGSGKTCTALRLHRSLASRFFESKDGSITPHQISVSYWELSAQNRARDLLSEEDIRILETSNVADDKSAEADASGYVAMSGASGSVAMSGLTSVTVGNVHDLLKSLEVSEERRSSRETVVHERSSRSHAFCRFVASYDTPQGETKKTITVVDLAGAENSLETFSNRGPAMEETKFISTSLSTLQECVRCLRLNQSHVPYRRSKLTMLLKDVLSAGGTTDHTKILWIAHLSPMSWDSSHSRRTIQFMKELQEVSVAPEKGPRPPEKWTKADVRKWVISLEDGKYAHMANALAWANGASLKQEWKYDLGKRLAASGDCTEEEGCDIYEAFHAEIAKFKKMHRK